MPTLQGIEFNILIEECAGLWLPAPERLSSERLSKDRPDHYAVRVAQLSTPGVFKVEVKNQQQSAVAVCIWISSPSPTGAGTGMKTLLLNPSLACGVQAHTIQPGEALCVAGLGKPGRCCQEKYTPFSVSAGFFSAGKYYKVKAAAYNLTPAGERTGDVPIAHCSLYVGRISDSAAIMHPSPGVGAVDNMLPEREPDATATGTLVGRCTPALSRDVAVFDFSRDSDDEGAGASSAPVVRPFRCIDVCVNDGLFKTHKVYVESVTLEGEPMRSESAPAQLIPFLQENSSPPLETASTDREGRVTTPPLDESDPVPVADDSVTAPAAVSEPPVVAQELEPPVMSLEEARAFDAFLRAAVALCPARPAMEVPPPLAGSKRPRVDNTPQVLLWDTNGVRLNCLQQVLRAPGGCVIVSVKPGDHFIAQEVIGTQPSEL